MLKRLTILPLVLCLSCRGLKAQEASSTARRFTKDLTAAASGLAGSLSVVEKVRLVARSASRKTPPLSWQKEWQKTKSKRAQFQREFETLAKRLTTAKISQDERSSLLELLLKSWLRHSDCQEIRASLSGNTPTLAKLLAKDRSDQARRSLLNIIKKRVASNPKRHDLDVLLEVVAWESILLAQFPGKHQRFETITQDLILLFTDRDTNGLTKSKAHYYIPGLLLDRGFKKSLRDASNQVRHFCWALRMFWRSKNHAVTESLLRFKEVRDAKTRQLPLNKADLRLNKLARQVGEALKLEAASPSVDGLLKLLRSLLNQETLTSAKDGEIER